MSRFKFRLEKLPGLARGAAQEAAGRFSEARRILLDKQEAHSAVKDERARRGQASPEPGSRVRVDALMTLNAHLAKLTAEVKCAAAEARTQALAVEQKRREFVNAKRDQRKFELLRERRFNEWKIRMIRREQRGVDEVASQRHQLAGQLHTADIAESHGKPSRYP